MTVTVYNKLDSGWYRTVLTGVSAQWNQSYEYQSGGAEGGQTSSLVLIPAQKNYVDPEAFAKLTDPTGVFTLRAGDGILLGTGADITGHLKTALPGAKVIRTVKERFPGSALDHWEVECR